MSFNMTFPTWNQLMDYLQSVDATQCFTVNYLPQTQEYECWIGNQPYEHYEKIIESEIKEKNDYRKQLNEMEEQVKAFEKTQEHSAHWEVGYKEVKNLIHNELKMTKEQLDQAIAKLVQKEVADVVGKNHDLIRTSIREIIREEMMVAINSEQYPRVRGNIWDYTPHSQSSFRQFISDILKEEVIKQLRNEFEVGIQIQSKKEVENSNE